MIWARTFVVVALALLSVSVAKAQGVPDDRCAGVSEGQAILIAASSQIRVAAAKREDFLTAVRAHGRGNGLVVGGATDNKGWVVVLMESRPPGVFIEVESTGENSFGATVLTCSGIEEWRSHWQTFMRFVDANRGQWS